ncbi:MAG: 50S ribosomal protein L18 [Verrucomicrobiota bacterium]
MKKAQVSSKFRRKRIHARVRKSICGSSEKPRLNVCFTGQHIYAQLIDDQQGKTIVGVSTTEKSLKSKVIRPNLDGASEIGKMIAERAKDKKISKVVFDRGGFLYHGKVKALADAAREGGLEF